MPRKIDKEKQIRNLKRSLAGIENEIKRLDAIDNISNNFNKVATNICEACEEFYLPTSSRQKVCFNCTPTKSWQARYRRYGITKPMFDLQIEKQEGNCPLCLEKLNLETKYGAVIDHCHVTGEFRSILCNHCNVTLHRFENPEYVARVFQYLKIDRR